MELIVYLLAGCLGGFLAGFLGVGGGTIFVPVILHIAQKQGISAIQLVNYTIAHSLFLTMSTGVVGSIKQYRSGNFHFTDSVSIGLWGTITALVTTFTINNWTWYSKPMFTFFFSLMLLPIIVKMISKKTNTELQEKPIESKKTAFSRGWIGLLTGSVSALSGLGGGIIMVPLMVNSLNYKQAKAVAISQGALPLMSFVMVVYYLIQAKVSSHAFQLDFKLLLPLLIGVVLCTPLGVKTSHIVSDKFAKIFFAVFALLVLVKMNFY